MRKIRAQADYHPRPVGPDGELLLDKFCAYCGAINAAGAFYCQHCREYILDQGPDLSSRLARISRRASGGKGERRPLVARAIEAQYPRFDSFVTKLENGEYQLFAVLCWPLITAANLFIYMMKAILNAFGWVMFGLTLYDLKGDSQTLGSRLAAENLEISAEARPRTPPDLSLRLARVRRHLPSLQAHHPENSAAHSLDGPSALSNRLIQLQRSAEATYSPQTNFEDRKRLASLLFAALWRFAEDIPGWLWFLFLWFVVLVLWLAILALR